LLEGLTLGWDSSRGVALLRILAWSEGLLGILALGRVSAGGDAAGGIVGGRDLGLPCSVATLGDAGNEFDGR
jgi:hypothetical protein